MSWLRDHITGKPTGFETSTLVFLFPQMVYFNNMKRSLGALSGMLNPPQPMGYTGEICEAKEYIFSIFLTMLRHYKIVQYLPTVLSYSYQSTRDNSPYWNMFLCNKFRQSSLDTNNYTDLKKLGERLSFGLSQVREKSGSENLTAEADTKPMFCDIDTRNNKSALKR